MRKIFLVEEKEERGIVDTTSSGIEIKGLRKEYFLGETIVHALRGIDLTIVKGDFLGIVGPSGSGKTTLLNIIGCIDDATAGSVRFGEREITRMSDEEKTDLRLHKIGFIFQTFNLIPVLTTLENVEFPLLLMKSRDTYNIRKRAEELIEAVGLTKHLKHKPAELSGGQRQRVAIARALITNPDLVLADEPTANLDSNTGKTVLDIMREMNRRGNTTFIFSTHDDNMLRYAKEIIKIKDGLIDRD